MVIKKTISEVCQITRTFISEINFLDSKNNQNLYYYPIIIDYYY